MRNAREFVEEYRAKGYPDERIRIVASMRPEPLRSEALKLLNKAALKDDAADADADAMVIKEIAEAETVVMEQPVSDARPPAAPVQEKAPEPVKDEASLASRSKEATSKPAPPPQERRPESVSGVPPAKLSEAMRRETMALRKERDELKSRLEAGAKELAKSTARIEALQSEAEEIAELRKRANQAAALGKELAKVRDQREELAKAKAEAEARIVDLDADLAGKAAVLAEKDKAVHSARESLAVERSERTQATAHLNELQELVDRQSDRLRELGGLSEQLAEANASTERLRGEADDLREREQANITRVTELEGNLSGVQEDASGLHLEIKANEAALDALQQKLDGRESDLETLREHFECEAKDLKKRAEQEMWMIRRKLGVFKRVGVLSAAVAALFLVGIFFLLATRPSVSRWEARVAEAEARVAQLESERTNWVARRGTPTPGAADDTAESPDRAPIRRVIIEAPPMTPPETPRATYDTHVVKKGDSLWTIAKEHYGNGAEYKRIEAANRLQPGQMLKPGVTLRIPRE